MKGGVGKSTITALLSQDAARRGFNVLAVDLDPQANLSQALMHDAYLNFIKEERPSIVEIFKDYQPATKNKNAPSPLNIKDTLHDVYVSKHGSLDLIPSRFSFSHFLTGAVLPDPEVLAKIIANDFQHKDLVFIDCAPTESILTRAAYHASGLILVPVRPEYFATIGFPLLQFSVKEFSKKHQPQQIKICGVVINNTTYDGGNNGALKRDAQWMISEQNAGKTNGKYTKMKFPFRGGFLK